MTLRTITFDDSTHKIVPLEISEEWRLNLARGNCEWDTAGDVITDVIQAAPEYQDVSLAIQFAWFIPDYGIFTRSKEECYTWIEKGHKVLPVHVIPAPYPDTIKDE